MDTMSYIISQYRKDTPEVYLPTQYSDIADARQAIVLSLLREVEHRMWEEDVHIRWHNHPTYGNWRVVASFGPVFTYTDYLCYEIHEE